MKGDVDSTTIAIAYPLNGIEQASSMRPPPQSLFAYLPLRPFGFRFILQADFEIPANRQDIRRDNLWNNWLLTEMPQLLHVAYLQFQRLPELLSSLDIDTQAYSQLTAIQTIKFFLKCLPSRNELDLYFHAFIDEVIQLLAGIIKFPVCVTSNDKGEPTIDWVSPSQCVIVRDPFIRTILSQDLLRSQFNSYYIHEELIDELDEHMLIKLGCRQLEFADVTRLIEVSYKQDEQTLKKTTASIQQSKCPENH